MSASSSRNTFQLPLPPLRRPSSPSCKYQQRQPQTTDCWQLMNLDDLWCFYLRAVPLTFSLSPFCREQITALNQCTFESLIIRRHTQQDRFLKLWIESEHIEIIWMSVSRCSLTTHQSQTHTYANKFFTTNKNKASPSCLQNWVQVQLSYLNVKPPNSFLPSLFPSLSLFLPRGLCSLPPGRFRADWACVTAKLQLTTPAVWDPNNTSWLLTSMALRVWEEADTHTYTHAQTTQAIRALWCQRCGEASVEHIITKPQPPPAAETSHRGGTGLSWSRRLLRLCAQTSETPFVVTLHN